MARMMPSIADWPGPVVIVEQMLGGRVVDCHHRDTKGAVGRHRLETDDTGGRLLGGADDLDVPPIGVEQRGQVGSVIHRDRRCVIEHGVDVLVVGIGVLAAYREHRDALGHEGGGDIVLGRERV